MLLGETALLLADIAANRCDADALAAIFVRDEEHGLKYRDLRAAFEGAQYAFSLPPSVPQQKRQSLLHEQSVILRRTELADMVDRDVFIRTEADQSAACRIEISELSRHRAAFDELSAVFDQRGELLQFIQ